MKQRVIWMPLLIIGILSSFQSCKKHVDSYLIHEYQYKNNSNYGVTVDVYNKVDRNFLKNSYNIPKGAEFTQQLDIMFDSKTGIIELADSVELFLDNNKKVNYGITTDSKFNILKEENYVKLKKSDKHVIFTYVFTDEDFNKADSIK